MGTSLNLPPLVPAQRRKWKYSNPSSQKWFTLPTSLKKNRGLMSKIYYLFSIWMHLSFSYKKWIESGFFFFKFSLAFCCLQAVQNPPQRTFSVSIWIGFSLSVVGFLFVISLSLAAVCLPGIFLTRFQPPQIILFSAKFSIWTLPWRDWEAMWLWHLGTWVIGSARGMAGPQNLGELFQPQGFCDSNNQYIKAEWIIQKKNIF